MSDKQQNNHKNLVNFIYKFVMDIESGIISLWFLTKFLNISSF